MLETFASLIREIIGRHTGRSPADVPVDVRLRNQGIEPETAGSILADLSEHYPTVEVRGLPFFPVSSAGVSSFGLGGTAAHPALPDAPGHPLRCAALAAATPEALREPAEQPAAERLEVRADPRLDAGAACRPGEGPCRATLTGKHFSEPAEALQGFTRGVIPRDRIPDAVGGRAVFADGSRLGPGFAYSDHGFQHAVARCDQAIEGPRPVPQAPALPKDIDNFDQQCSTASRKKPQATGCTEVGSKAWQERRIA